MSFLNKNNKAPRVIKMILLQILLAEIYSSAHELLIHTEIKHKKTKPK